MIDRAGHIAGAADAVAVFQKHCGTGDEHAIADLICDLGHLADERGFDFLSEVKPALGIGTPSITLLIATISARTLRSRSPSRQDNCSSHCSICRQSVSPKQPDSVTSMGSLLRPNPQDDKPKRERIRVALGCLTRLR